MNMSINLPRNIDTIQFSNEDKLIYNGQNIVSIDYKFEYSMGYLFDVRTVYKEEEIIKTKA